MAAASLNVGLRVPSDGDVDVLKSLLEVRQGRKDLDEELKKNPELLRLHRRAEEILRAEREAFRRLPMPRAKQGSLASRVAVEWALDANDANPLQSRSCCSAVFAKVYRYLCSDEFSTKCRRGDVAAISGDVLNELCIAFAIKELGPLARGLLERLREKFGLFMEQVGGQACGLGARSAAPVIALFLVMVLTTPVESSWEALAPTLLFGCLKTGICLLTSVWWSVPLIMFVDSCAEQYSWLRAYDHSVPSAAAHAVRGALLNWTPVRWIVDAYGSMFSHETAPRVISEDMLHPDDFVHESFQDVVGYLSAVEDPVFLHGFQFSRSTVDALFERGYTEHPFTRRGILRAHVQEPPPEWTQLYLKYMHLRHSLIQLSLPAAAEQARLS